MGDLKPGKYFTRRGQLARVDSVLWDGTSAQNVLKGAIIFASWGKEKRAEWNIEGRASLFGEEGMDDLMMWISRW